MRILVSGIMGSGKSTQAKRLASEYHLCFLTTGDVLRAMAREDSEKGRVVKQALDTGAMVDDAIVADLIKQRLAQGDAKAGFVSDSYPRHLKQLDYFDPNLEIIFFLFFSPEVAKQRLLKRGRSDDTEELIDYRHKTQGAKIKEIVDYYRDKIKVFDINGELSEDEVYNQIKAYLP
ncbi:nucleoside monophosphate kinase [Candidatus Daviesbacteria bacterium]|nr:nucleoside monophosphate kinase [Candidatus Daviesbacteria bacterium]